MALCDETKPLLQGETTGRVAPMHFIFAKKNLDNEENRPQNTCVSSNKLCVCLSLKVKYGDTIVRLKVMLFLCYKKFYNIASKFV